MKICSFEGCGRKYCSKGYCKVHYGMLKKEVVLRPIGQPGRRKGSGTIRLCSIDGCGRKHEAKGFCKRHWSQQHYKRPFSDIQIREKNLNKLCSVNECKQRPCAHGYCQKHYYRWRTNGTTNLIPRTVARKECKQPGCETPKHNEGYCFRHYREVILQVPANPRGGHNKKPKEPCSVDGCEGFARIKGWCDKHYGRYRRNGDPLTCYRRPRQSSYVTVDNILKSKGNYSKLDDEEVLRENFSDIYNRYDEEACY